MDSIVKGRGVALGVLQRAQCIDRAEALARRRISLCGSTESNSSLSSSTNTLSCDNENSFAFSFTNGSARISNALKDGDDFDRGSDAESEEFYRQTWQKRAKCYSDFNSNSYGMQRSLSVFDNSDEDPLVFPKMFSWDWPFCDEEIARGVYTEEKFTICLPFNKGGTGETHGSTKKFDKIAEANFSWTVGLSSSGDEIFSGTCFWRMEIEIIPNLNMLALVVSRDITRSSTTTCKRLKRLRKVYRLPDHYDVTTLTSTSYDWAIVIEAFQRRKPYRAGLRRSNTLSN